jgi:DedD protein
MEIKGDEFLRNVQVRQEEEILRQKLGEFENTRQNNSSNPYNNQEYVNADPYNDNELGDILLQNSNRNGEYQDNKKKYIVLGVALVLLFVITVVIIRLISTDSASNDVKPQEQSILEQDKALNDDKIQQEYQQILNDKLKKVDGTGAEVPKEGLDDIKTLETQEESLPVKNTQQSNPLNVVKDEPVIAEEPQEEPEPVIKETKKEVSKPQSVKTATKTQSAATSKGLYVQIGAFSQKPTDKYLADIEAKGFEYKLHSVTVQGKELTKLLIGPYDNRTEVNSKLNAIKKTFNAPNAFVLEL